MRSLSRVLAALAALALLTGAAPATRDPVEHFFHPFLGDLREELAEAKATGRRGLVVMYHFEECPACIKMKASVLNQTRVQDWYRKAFKVIALDIRGAQPVTGLDGRTLPENQYAALAEIRATPTFDFYDAAGTRVNRHVGGLYAADEFLLLGRYVASGAYRNQSFAAYKRAKPKKGT